MNNNLTELVVILDMSGSMHPLQSDTIGGYNTLIEEQKAEEGEARVTTALFDNRYMLLHDGVDVKDVPPLTEKEYHPMGTTALLDAVGKTINSIGHKLALTPEEERPGKVLFTIITDGYENASREYKWDTVKDMIKEQTEKYNWVFTFIGADIDNIRVSDSLGIDRTLSKKFTKSGAGASSVFESVSKSMSRLRTSDISMDEARMAVAEELNNIE